VIKVISGGVAALDGRLLVGDEIITLNGFATNTLKSNKCVDIFKGKEWVSLVVKRTGLLPPSVSNFIDLIRNGYQV